ncbi:retrotransposon protein, putative, ty1-copia subclass [Tanacetum coccineum]
MRFDAHYSHLESQPLRTEHNVTNRVLRPSVDAFEGQSNHYGRDPYSLRCQSHKHKRRHARNAENATTRGCDRALSISLSGTRTPDQETNAVRCTVDYSRDGSRGEGAQHDQERAESTQRYTRDTLYEQAGSIVTEEGGVNKRGRIEGGCTGHEVNKTDGEEAFSSIPRMMICLLIYNGIQFYFDDRRAESVVIPTQSTRIGFPKTAFKGVVERPRMVIYAEFQGLEESRHASSVRNRVGLWVESLAEVNALHEEHIYTYSISQVVLTHQTERWIVTTDSAGDLSTLYPLIRHTLERRYDSRLSHSKLRLSSDSRLLELPMTGLMVLVMDEVDYCTYDKLINVGGDTCDCVVKEETLLVIQGFRQREGLDYFDTYSPVTRITSIRTIIAIAALRNLEIHQMDVKTAFLNGDLEEEIYMNQPEGFIAPGQEGKVCRLVKSLYGLKQAPKQWHQKFDHTMLESGFKINECDKCVYVKDTSAGYVILCLYVDDMLIVGSNDKIIRSTKDMLKSKFDMKDMGLADVILGIKIIRTQNGLVLSQAHYVDKILNTHNAGDSGQARTPIDTSTRSDLAYAVSRLSRYTSNLSYAHWKAITRVLHYLRYNYDYGLHYDKHPAVIEGYSDANWISDIKDSRSTSGYVFTLGGVAIS